MQILRPLARRPLALVWAGQLLAATGSELYTVAVVWLATAMIGAQAGYVSAFQAGALLVGSLFGGLLTDRWRYGPTLIAMNVVRALLLAGLGIAGLAGQIGLPLLALAAGLVALATSAFEPALQAIVPTLAPDPVLRHATNGLFDATKRMARILGPSLVVLVGAVLPIAQFFFVTALGFAIATLCLLRGLRGIALPVRADAPRGAAAVLDSLAGGIVTVRGHAVMVYGLFANLVGNVTWAMGVLLGMVLHLRAASADPLADYSLMMMAYGAGNLGANLLLAGRTPRRPILWLVGAKLVFGLGVCLMPWAPDRATLMLAAAFAAINGPLENLALLHLMQTEFPTHRLAQVFRLQMGAVYAGILLAYLAAPSLFARLGVDVAITCAALATLAVGLAGTALLRRRSVVPRPSQAA